MFSGQIPDQQTHSSAETIDRAGVKINDASFGVSKDFAGLLSNNASSARQRSFCRTASNKLGVLFYYSD
jgi:hypothetical protein